MKMFIELIKANFKETLRDHMLVFWFILFPVVFSLVFGAIYANMGVSDKGEKSNEPEKNNNAITFNIGLISDSEDNLNKSLEFALKSVDMFKVTVGKQEDELKKFLEGKRNIIIILPKDLSKEIAKGKPVEIPIYHDYLGSTALYGVSEILNFTERSIDKRPQLFAIKTYNDYTGYGPEMKGIQKKENGKQEEVKSEEKQQKNALNPIDHVLPGILALTIMQLGLFGSLRVISLRGQKTLKALGVTPLPRMMFLTSEIVMRVLMSFIQAAMIICIGHFAFGLTLSSNWLVIFGWIILGVAAFIALGYMLTTFTKTVDSGNALMQVIQFPMMLLSGIFISKDLLPAFVRPVVDVMPLAYLADGFRSAMTGTVPIYGYLTDFAVLAGILVVSFAIAISRFRWE